MTEKRPFSRRHARKAQQWIVRLASGDITQPQMDRFHAWLGRDARHRAAFQHQRAAWQALDRIRDEVLAAQSTPRRVPSPSRPWYFRPAPIAAAAALVLAVSAWQLPEAWLAMQADHRTGIHTQSLTLQDGTRVVLDADSAIAVDFGDDARRIRLLRGQAWFDVAHRPHPFIVEAQGGTVRDIGTAFEVGLDADRAHAAVGQGLVEVASHPDRRDAVRVTEGQRVSYRKGGPVSAPTPVDPTGVGAWRQGEILLDSVPVATAIERIARYRSAPVWAIGDLDRLVPVTAVFHTDSPDAALQALATRNGLRIRRLPGGALLVSPAAR
ncbi:MAG: FecR domain-containing protein [Pseudoxanthomonas sp.]